MLILPKSVYSLFLPLATWYTLVTFCTSSNHREPSLVHIWSHSSRLKVHTIMINLIFNWHIKFPASNCDHISYYQHEKQFSIVTFISMRRVLARTLLAKHPKKAENQAQNTKQRRECNILVGNIHVIFVFRSYHCNIILLCHLDL